MQCFGKECPHTNQPARAAFRNCNQSYWVRVDLDLGKQLGFSIQVLQPPEFDDEFSSDQKSAVPLTLILDPCNVSYNNYPIDCGYENPHMAKIPYCHHWVYQEVVASPTLRDVSVPFMRQIGSLGPLGMGQPHFRPRDAGDGISHMCLQGHSTNI